MKPVWSSEITDGRRVSNLLAGVFASIFTFKSDIGRFGTAFSRVLILFKDN